MSFLNDRESIILMDTPDFYGKRHGVDDLKAMRDAGIETALIHALYMDDYFKDPSYLDTHLDRIRTGGMKAIMPLWNHHGSKFAPSWYAKRNDGSWPHFGPDLREYILSPWSVDAQGYYNSLLQRIHDQYTAPDCQVISCLFRDGEMMLPTDPLWGDESAVQSRKQAHNHGLSDADWLRQTYTLMNLEQQRILVDTPWHEIWFSLQPGKRGRLCNGCDWIPDYLKAWQAELHPTNINMISYSIFGQPTVPAMLQDIHNEFGTLHWVGAEYCEGLQQGNREKVFELGFRGFILAPCHPYTHHPALEPWMLGEIRKTVELFASARVNA